MDNTVLHRQREPMFAESLSFAVPEWEKTVRWYFFFNSVCGTSCSESRRKETV